MSINEVSLYGEVGRMTPDYSTEYGHYMKAPVKLVKPNGKPVTVLVTFDTRTVPDGGFPQKACLIGSLRTRAYKNVYREYSNKTIIFIERVGTRKQAMDNYAILEGTIGDEFHDCVTPEGVPYVKFDLLVPRHGKYDVVTCTAWRRIREDILHLRPGSKMIVEGFVTKSFVAIPDYERPTYEVSVTKVLVSK